MTPSQMLVTTQEVRDYIKLNTNATSNYSDQTINSNIRAATWTLQMRTGRQFVDETATKTFSSNGDLYVPIPGLRTATTISRAGSALTADSTYWLVPDAQQSGLYIAVQFGAFGVRRYDGPWYLQHRGWFDQNLDSPYWLAHPSNGLPNDVSIAGSWGYATHDTTPDPVLLAAKAQAAIYCLNAEGIDTSYIQGEVDAFVAEWAIRQHAMVT